MAGYYDYKLVVHVSVYLSVHLSTIKVVDQGTRFVQRCPNKHTNDTFGDYLGLFRDFYVIIPLQMFVYGEWGGGWALQ